MFPVLKKRIIILQMCWMSTQRSMGDIIYGDRSGACQKKKALTGWITRGLCGMNTVIGFCVIFASTSRCLHVFTREDQELIYIIKHVHLLFSNSSISPSDHSVLSCASSVSGFCRNVSFRVIRSRWACIPLWPNHAHVPVNAYVFSECLCKKR